MNKRKKVHERLKSRLNAMLPSADSQFQLEKSMNTTINVNTEKLRVSKTSNPKKFDSNRSFEPKPRNLKYNMQDPLGVRINRGGGYNGFADRNRSMLGDINLSYSSLTRKARGNTADNVYTNHPNFRALPTLDHNKMSIRESLESKVGVYFKLRILKRVCRVIL